MKASMRVNVTQGNINEGCRSDEENCPIARAVYDIVQPEAIGSPLYVEVDGLFAMIYNDGATEDDEDIHTTFKLPPRAQTFIQNFDAGKPVQPFAFTMTQRKFS